jgi:hypothetical protein
VEEFAGFLLMLLAAAIAINLVNGGRQGVRDWLHAKFIGTSS